MSTKVQVKDIATSNAVDPAKFLKWDGSWGEAGWGVVEWIIIPWSTYSIPWDNTVYADLTTSFVKKYEFLVNKSWGYTLYMNYGGDFQNSTAVYFDVHINDISVWIFSWSFTGWQTLTTDINVSAWDNIKIYCKNDNWTTLDTANWVSFKMTIDYSSLITSI